MLRKRYCLCVLCAVLASAMAALLLLGNAGPSAAQTPAAPVQVAQAPPKGPVSFVNDVAPILKECFACHDAKKRKGKLDMTTLEAFRKGGDNDDPIVPGKPDESNLISLLTTTTARRMPPKDAGEPLTKAKIAIIEQWIKEGAKADVDAKADLYRELRLRFKPPAPPAAYKFPWMINALVFTPDNKKLVVGGHHELTVWDVDSGKLEKRIHTRAERAKAMLILPDGKLVVAGSRPGQEGDVRVYDINAGMAKEVDGVQVIDGVNDKAVMLKELVSTDDEVLCLAASDDGKRLAAGGVDRLVRVWDISNLAEPKLEQTSENHADWVMGVALAPDGKHMLTASRDKTAKVWDLVAKESVLTFPDHQQPVHGVAVSADSKVAFTVGEDGNLRRWDTASGKAVGGAVAAHGKGALKVVTDPKRQIVATCGVDNTAKTWTAAGAAGKAPAPGHTDQVFAVAISPDGTLVASGSFNGEVRICKVADGALLKSFNGSPGYVAATPEPKK